MYLLIINYIRINKNHILLDQVQLDYKVKITQKSNMIKVKYINMKFFQKIKKHIQFKKKFRILIPEYMDSKFLSSIYL